jgi:phage-related protein (TIGR01555 family)
MFPFSLFRRQPPAAPELPKRNRLFSTDHDMPGTGRATLEQMADRIRATRPRIQAVEGATMDSSSDGSFRGFDDLQVSNLPDALVGWYAAQSFIGYQMCAIIAQHWLIDKACTMPARDAIRHGFDLQVSGAPVEDDNSDIAEEIEKQDKLFRLGWNMEQFVRMGRVFGIRVAFFKVDSDDPLYYEKPFNPDGILPGSYKGIVQVDPYWCVPVLDIESSSDPASVHFYEPAWWIINGKKYHRSHLCIFRNSEVPDLLKPLYQYGGISVPQKIMERVYAAERTANEGPQLAMTKRTMVLKTDVAEALGNQTKFVEHMQVFTQLMNNFGVKVVDTDDTMEQFDTSLSDIDAVIMTQYQLVSAAANVPGTKLLGTTPKGFNSSGGYEESSYHEELESIQANDLTAFVDRHHELVMRSIVLPAHGLAAGVITVKIDWAPVDSPSALEYADINLKKAQTDGLYVTAGAIDGHDIRNRLKADPNSEYTDIPDVMDEGDVPDATPDPAAATPDQ